MQLWTQIRRIRKIEGHSLPTAVRRAVARPDIDKLKASGDVEGLIKALNNCPPEDRYSPTRMNAARALGGFDDERVVPALTEMILNEDDHNHGAKEVATEALRKLVGDTEAEALLIPRSPVASARQHVSPLVDFGLVSAAIDGGTAGYQLTADGLLYADAMLGERDCPDHPSMFDDLKAVSRGRTMILDAEELTALATIALGERFTDHVAERAGTMGLEQWIDGALLRFAGSMAHGVRHSPSDEWTPAQPLAEIEFGSEARSAFERQLSAGQPHEDIARLTRAALDEWPFCGTA